MGIGDGQSQVLLLGRRCGSSDDRNGAFRCAGSVPQAGTERLKASGERLRLSQFGTWVTVWGAR